MDRQAGAPPDIFGPLGQNWGFPTYNWPRMAEDRYAWWQNRLQKMSSCFDAIRIDHILGFFRIWEVPRRFSEGIMGHFNPAMPLSREEIGQYGFHREPALFDHPAIADWKIKELFGDDSAKVVDQLLYRDEEGWFRVKPEYDSESARGAWYARACGPEEAARIEDAMKRLGYEVLFLADPDQAGRFHPRVTLQKTHLFFTMSPDEQAALSRLHDDFFYRRHTHFWEQEAMKKLPALMDASRMLICGEDLGMIPDCVPGVLSRLGILSLEIQRMPKRPGQLFGEPNEFPYMSVCATSTHDMPVFRGWWEEEPEARQQFFNQALGRPGQAPRECSPEISGQIAEQHLGCPSMWCILPLQDWLAMDKDLRRPDPLDERINVPATPRHYWRYRMHLSIEQLLRAAEYNRRISRMIQESGR
jgi:4-alpha-glucanotransferase